MGLWRSFSSTGAIPRLWRMIWDIWNPLCQSVKLSLDTQSERYPPVCLCVKCFMLLPPCQKIDDMIANIDKDEIDKACRAMVMRGGGIVQENETRLLQQETCLSLIMSQWSPLHLVPDLANLHPMHQGVVMPHASHVWTSCPLSLNVTVQSRCHK